MVFLVDEYDKPIIDFITDIPKADVNREVLRNFFSPLKHLEAEGHLRFLFITGISKFSKVSLFSDLNNLTDLTISRLSTDLTGITQEEMEAYFEPHIQRSVDYINIDKITLLKEIKTWYNGYSWDGKTFVYNPFSLLSFFAHSQFHNFWFASGTPTFLVELLRNNDDIKMEKIEEKEVMPASFDKFSIEKIDIYNLLFQTGYLTIKSMRLKGVQPKYRLGYPNEEIRQAFTHNLLEAYTDKVPAIVSDILLKMEDALQQGSVDNFVEQLKILLSGISYHISPSKNKQNTEEALFTAWEGYFHTIIYLVTVFLKLHVQCEVTKHKGRLDMMIETDKYLYLMEFKLDQPAENAIQQIKEREYMQSYLNSEKEIILVGIGFSKEERNVETWESERR